MLRGRFSIATYRKLRGIECNRKCPNPFSQFREIAVTFFGQFSSDFIWHSSERKPKLGFPQNKIVCRKPIATSWSRSCCTLLSKSSRRSELGRAPEFYFCLWVRISFSPARSLSWFVFFFSLRVVEQSSGRKVLDLSFRAIFRPLDFWGYFGPDLRSGEIFACWTRFTKGILFPKMTFEARWKMLSNEV